MEESPFPGSLALAAHCTETTVLSTEYYLLEDFSSETELKGLER